MKRETPDFSDMRSMKNGLSRGVINAIKRYNSVSGLCEIDSNLSISEIREQLSHAFSCVDAATCALQHIEGELNKLDD